MIALKFEIRATANGTNIFASQDTIVEISFDKGSIDKACMIGMGSFSTPKEMLIVSNFISNNLVNVRSETKFEELTHGGLARGSYRVLAKRL